MGKVASMLSILVMIISPDGKGLLNEMHGGQTLAHLALGQILSAHTLKDGQEALNLKVDVNLVALDVIVRNRSGGLIGGLQASDFLVYDNGVAQQLTQFSRDQLPLAVALVIDRSPSVSAYLQRLSRTAISTLQHLRVEDQVVLFSFSTCPIRHNDLTNNHDQLVQEIGKIKSFKAGNTNITCALFNAARYLHTNAPNRRRAIILISDNAPNLFPIKEDEVIREALESSVTILSIRTPGAVPVVRNESELSAVDRIARGTGGEVLSIAYSAQLPDAMDSAILNLRLRYTLGFVPSNIGEIGTFHTLVVKLSQKVQCQNCLVQTRSGYYNGPQKSSAEPNRNREIEPDCSCEQTIASLMKNFSAVGTHAGLISFMVRTAEYKDADYQEMIKVDLQIVPKNIEFQTFFNRCKARLLIALFSKDAKGNMIEEQWKTLDIQLEDEACQQLMPSQIAFSMSIPRRVVEQIINIVVFDMESQNIGARSIKMKLPHHTVQKSSWFCESADSLLPINRDRKRCLLRSGFVAVK